MNCRNSLNIKVSLFIIIPIIIIIMSVGILTILHTYNISRDMSLVTIDQISEVQLLNMRDLINNELNFMKGIKFVSEELYCSNIRNRRIYENVMCKFSKKISENAEAVFLLFLPNAIDNDNIYKNDSSYKNINGRFGIYMGKDKETVYNQVKSKITQISELLKKEKINVWIRPETTGKSTQWGDLEEIISLSKEFDNVLPCIDFSHLHARSGGEYNTYDEFSKILETVGNEIGTYALENFHGHLAGIDYSSKGEKKHLNLEESDMNYKNLLKAMKEFGIKGALVCESPNIEDDAKLLKTYYESL